jgi:hypothetical protein
MRLLAIVTFDTIRKLPPRQFSIQAALANLELVYFDATCCIIVAFQLLTKMKYMFLQRDCFLLHWWIIL